MRRGAMTRRWWVANRWRLSARRRSRKAASWAASRGRSNTSVRTKTCVRTDGLLVTAIPPIFFPHLHPPRACGTLSPVLPHHTVHGFLHARARRYHRVRSLSAHSPLTLRSLSAHSPLTRAPCLLLPIPLAHSSTHRQFHGLCQLVRCLRGGGADVARPCDPIRGCTAGVRVEELCLRDSRGGIHGVAEQADDESVPDAVQGGAKRREDVPPHTYRRMRTSVAFLVYWGGE